jgi:hypothetical protein
MTTERLVKPDRIIRSIRELVSLLEDAVTSDQGAGGTILRRRYASTGVRVQTKRL